MVARKLPVGVVTGLRGNIRHNQVICKGEAGHAGAVPRWLRHATVLATADLLSRLDTHWAALQERGLDLVLTVGILTTNQNDHAMSRIPGECRFCLEIRSQSIDTLEAFYQLIQSETKNVSRERGVTFDFDKRSMSSPATMDNRWVEHLLKICDKKGMTAEALPSGAGHDAGVFANIGIPSAMIFVRNENGSHNPLEAMDLNDFMDAVARVSELDDLFLMFGQRHNLSVPEFLDFNSGWSTNLRKRLDSHGTLGSSSGEDYIVFPKGYFLEMLKVT